MKPSIFIDLILKFNSLCRPQKGLDHANIFALSRRSSSTAKTNSSILELTSGAGGSEAMLFANEMLSLYLSFAARMRWPLRIEEQVVSDLGGIKFAKIIINSPDAFSKLIQEAGVHRVQRVPKTEKSGRIHTSTITVSVVPRSVVEFKLNEKDVVQQTKRSSGPGGQHVNKVETAVRLTHKPTGVVVECQESRFQADNRKIALANLSKKLKEMEMKRITDEVTRLRKSQVGHADRNEKIRTYNFPQDRITDHRLGKSYHNLRGMLDGDISVFEKILQDFQ